MTVDPNSRPAPRPGVRITHDPVRDQTALLYPEGVLMLNETATAVLGLCDGMRSVGDITGELGNTYDGVTLGDVLSLLVDLHDRKVLSTDGSGRPASTPDSRANPTPATARSPAPLGLLAELTYRCPLHCTYCANPLNLTDYRDDLDSVRWRRVLDEARAMGVLQVHFSGGEPLLRRDLPDLVGHARSQGMYVNLITSGIPCTPRTLTRLVDAGLDHFQLSIQDVQVTEADTVAGFPAHERKLLVAGWVREHGLPLTVNTVLHRGNVDRLLDIAALAAAMGAARLELAHTQFYGWALRNRAALIPTRAQVEVARRDAATARQRYGERMEIVHVLADYHSDTPKPCMSGWGSRQLVVAPNGDVLPCLAAAQLPGLTIPNARHQPLADIWYDSPAFNRFRGTGWMPDPCRSCALREVDFGGCRCQAYQLAGDPAVTDPVCVLSPHHDRIAALLRTDTAAVATPRRMR